MIKLITTNSYFNLFPTLINLIEQGGKDIERTNIVFCEEKVSLMIERMLVMKMGGSFNTDVYSFGNFLRVKKPDVNALSKEGSAMVVKKILSDARLSCFKASRLSLAPTISELIMQLKSAKVSPEELLNAKEKCSGVLKNKLTDVYEVFSRYEQFLNERGLDDQSSSLSYLNEVISESQEIKKADVFIVGFSGFTKQQRTAIQALIDNAKSVTAILTEGENPLAFVNETAGFIKSVAKEKGVPFLCEKQNSDYTFEAQQIIDTIFCSAKKGDKKEGQQSSIYCGKPLTSQKEVALVGQIIKSKVIEGGCRYRDFTIAVPDAIGYGEDIKKEFNRLGIPFFLDVKKKVENHPLITLICAYLDVFNKNFERRALSAFFKNPLFESDKHLTDLFENYIIKYNVNYSKIKQPFTFAKKGKEDLNQLEQFRQRLVLALDNFDVRKMLLNLEVEKKIEQYSALLKEVGEAEESAVNDQVYAHVNSILDQMTTLLSGVKMSILEFKNIFLSGVGALEISIIPQYNDAVFVGAYKETALAKAKTLFCLGLTQDVPSVQADVALLNDGDLEKLESVKLLVEPKIRVVNHRMRENIAMALGAYSEKLYVLCPLLSADGQKNAESEVFTHIKNSFDCLDLPQEKEYLTYEQGVYSFAKDCGLFVDNQSDFVNACSFYHAIDGKKLDRLLKYANKELQIKLDLNDPDVLGEYISPTQIENYFKCPYHAFLNHKIRLKQREEGEVKAFSVGTLMHEIFKSYAEKLDEVCDKESSDKIVSEIFEQIVATDEYKRFMMDGVTKASIQRVLRESKKYCYRTYLYMKDCAFKIKAQEVSFGDRKKDKYPPVKLLDGKVKVKGKIDRVDASDNYFRVLDYKTGKADILDKNLYAGVKLQLYLYAAAVAQQESDKQLAGLYYLPVADKYEKPEDKTPSLAVGKTLKENQAINEQDKNVLSNKTSEFLSLTHAGTRISNSLMKDALQCCVDYAVKVSEVGVAEMKEGVIVPSAFENNCDYCEYKAMCGLAKVYSRKVDKVTEDTFFIAIKGGADNA